MTTDPGDGRYAFALDGGDPRPDPRSRWQPDGVHAPSALVDTAAFPWSDEGWRGVPLHDAVVFELHVGTFTPAGTFDAAVEHQGSIDAFLQQGMDERADTAASWAGLAQLTARLGGA